MKNDPKALAAFRAMTQEQREAAQAQGQADPANRILNEIDTAETQQQAADMLAECRNLLQKLSSGERKRVLRQVNKMIDEKPVL